MTDDPQENKAEGVSDASRTCKAKGCQARKIGTKPTFTCLSRGCLFADYVPDAPVPSEAELDFQREPVEGGRKGDGFPGQTGDLLNKRPTKTDDCN